ncbi:MULTISPECIES: ABC transporter ATP-binding protein [Methanosarcina]|uniref:Oligopeptide transport ATP-binding protein OppF n=4 Tax=Methanosarcina barkeri TaxID=2208 RepID=A0A0E3QYB5_METBA|nr:MULTISPECIES: ABC transporter ATP-binding protein [Methanosarcina]AKB55842.1 Oligopeptide transport ATP-binding protein OppF [Methanosarcina barkeri MS]AKB59318.1 Oligopeptide transport ATP-binding protein OppF [Methanosarcina barkeri 227]AKJ39981.1 dipeptide/oligopeptide/nickel ABC transporter ATP-binding protein [Methanosarcina barkeri CM1]OED10209.1 peptide ABC transporter ATP-binding protein [Methanosarcina sp. A14]
MFSISLRADSISKTYGKGLLSKGKCIFREVSFEIRSGETFGLMGPSGEGKSTLGRVIAGLEKPTYGTVYYGSSPLPEMNKTEHITFRRKVQIMFQDPTGAFNPRKKIGSSVFDVLKLLQIPHIEHASKTKEMLMTIGLPEEVLSRYPSQLSGGQLQRLELGRILLLEPEYIVLDEPTSALDVSVQAQTLHMLKKVQAEKSIGYLLISHDEAVIRFMSDSCGLLENRQLRLID